MSAAAEPVDPRRVRLWVVGFGTVGRWVIRALHERGERIAERYGVTFEVVGLANRRDGFIHVPDGLDLGRVLDLVSPGASITEHPGTERHPSALEGMRSSDADVLVEVTASPSDGGQPGVDHIRGALERGIPVVTSNKWPVALAGVELAALARQRSTELRAESTVMSGTPLLGPLVEGLAGATPLGLRGVLNATANFILTEIAAGKPYEDALADAQAAGLAEPDPRADVDGHDTVAKVMILAATVFGRQLSRDEVRSRGISALTSAEIELARSDDRRLREVATLDFSEPDGAGAVTARVEPIPLTTDDPLARIAGTNNAVVCRADPLAEITIAGPGAGPQLAGQGVLSDLIAVARRARDARSR